MSLLHSQVPFFLKNKEEEKGQEEERAKERKEKEGKESPSVYGVSSLSKVFTIVKHSKEGLTFFYKAKEIMYRVVLHLENYTVRHSQS